MREILFRLAMLARRFSARLGRARRARELSEEMAYHVEMLTRDAIARGVKPDVARAAALRRFGNRTTLAEEAHDMWGLGSLDDLLRDAKLALRGFRRTPTFAVTAVLILGLGIGMATAMFTVFRAVVLQHLPVREPDRVVALSTFRDPAAELPVSLNEIDALRRDSRTQQGVAGVVQYGAFPVPLVDGDRSLVLDVGRVTPNFFDVLDTRPVLGRLLRPEDTGHVMVLSYRTWQRQFGGDSTIVGRRLLEAFDQRSYTIVGVAPPGLDYPVGTDFWVSAGGGFGYDVIARLAPTATPATARSEFLSLAQRLDAQQEAPVHPTGAALRTLTQAALGNARPVLVALTAAVTLLLLIACGNVGTLLLLRAARRKRELVIRRALGASIGQIARLLVMESALLGVAGGVLGLACAEGLLRIVLAGASAALPRLDMIRLAGTPVGVAAGVAFVAVLLFGLLPALTAIRGTPASTLRLDARSGTETRRRRRMRRALVASQVALAVVVLAGAGLLVRSLARLEHLDLGYDTDHLSVGQLTFPSATYQSRSELYAMFDRLYERLRAVPGVTALTPVLDVPFSGASTWQIRPEIAGQLQAQAEANPAVAVECGGAEYFRTFGIPILRGRGFTDDDRENAPKVVVVSEEMAHRFWPGGTAIGKRLRLPGLDSAEWRTVVGVAGDIRFHSLRQSIPTLYLPWRQSLTQGVFAVRTRGELASVLPAMRRVVRSFGSPFDFWHAATMDVYLAGPLAQPRLSALLLSGFGLVALVLAAIGLYGVMASAVREQTRELGIRLALGATPRQLRQRVIRHALIVTSAGAMVGLAGALVSSRLLESLLFQVSPSDPVTLGAVCVLLTVVALAAAYLPARRATRVDPAQVLRAD
jgi:predicted permease